MDGTPSAPAQDRDSGAAENRAGRFGAQVVSCGSGSQVRAACVFTQSGGRVARGQCLDVQPKGAPADRDGADAVGNTARSCRRTRADPRRAPAPRPRHDTAGRAAGTQAKRVGRCPRPDPSRTRDRQIARRDRTRTQQRQDRDEPGRSAVVALDDSQHPHPHREMSFYRATRATREAIFEGGSLERAG